MVTNKDDRVVRICSSPIIRPSMKCHYEDNELIGVSDYSVIKGRMELSILEVRESLRNRGYGTKIFKDIIKEGINKGATNIVLTTGSDSAGFYREKGMMEIRTNSGIYTFKGDKKWMNKFIKS